LLAVVAGSAVIAQGSSTAATTPLKFMFGGHGYGTSVAGGGVSSGRTAEVTMWCSTKPGIHNRNNIASVQVPGVMTIGEVVSTADGTLVPDGKKASASTALQNISMLGGLITADQLKAVSTTVHKRSGFKLSDAGAIWSNVAIVGQTIPSQVPAPNTRVDIPLVGYAILNEQTRSTLAHKAVLSINMVHLHVTQDNPLLGVKKGLNVVIGHASSSLINVAGPLGGQAYTTNLNVDAGGLLTSGPSAVLYLPCAGTDGRVKSNSIGSVTVPGVLSIGSGKNTGSGVANPRTVKGQISSSVQSIRMLGGVISADAVNAAVTGVKQNGVRRFTDVSTGFVNLVVNGQSFGGDVPANTKIDIPNVGTLWLHHVVRTAHSLRVTMLELKLSTAGLGVPAGTTLRMVSAQLSIH
jgi:hypothetical protein